MAEVLAHELIHGAVVQARLSLAAFVRIDLDGLRVHALVVEVFFGPVAHVASPAPPVASIVVTTRCASRTVRSACGSCAAIEVSTPRAWRRRSQGIVGWRVGR